MNEQSPLLEKEKKSWIGRLLKLTFILLAIVLTVITVLFNMGGTSDSLKAHVESYISATFAGRKTHVGTLVNMSFFPRVGLDVKNVMVLDQADNGYPVFQAGRVQAYMSFWNVATQNPRFSKLYAEDIKALKGILIPREVTLEKLYVDHDLETGQAWLHANGTLDIHPWSVKAGLTVYGVSGSYSYSLAGEIPLEIKIADIEVQTTVANHEPGYFKMSDFILRSSQAKVSGDIVLSAIAPRMMKVKSDLKVSTDFSDETDASLRTDLVVDVTSYPYKYSGSVNAENMHIDDVFGEADALHMLKRIYEILGYEHMSQSGDLVKEILFASGAEIDVSFDFKRLILSSEDNIDITFPLQKQEKRLKFGPVMKTGQMLFPAVFMLPNAGAPGAYDMLVQDGRVESAFAEQWVLFMPDAFKNVDVVDIACATGRFTIGPNILRFDDFDLESSAGTVSLTDHKIETAAFSDINLGEGYGVRRDLPPVVLEKVAYDFVQASLQRSATPSQCAPYVVLKGQEE